MNTSEWFDALFHAHYPRVVGMLGRLMGDRGQAEEIAADAFCKLARQRAVVDSGGLTAWLYRVARNRITDLFRRSASSACYRRSNRATRNSCCCVPTACLTAS